MTFQWLRSVSILILATWIYETKTIFTTSHVIMLVGVEGVGAVLSQVHEEYIQIKTIGTVKAQAHDVNGADCIDSAPNNGLI